MKKTAGGLLIAPLALFAVACGPSTSSTSGPVLTAPSSAPLTTTAPTPAHLTPKVTPATHAATVGCHIRYDSSGDLLPDPHCTPGAVLTTSVADVCSPDWASNHREEFSKTARERAYARYGIVTTDPAGYGEYDHLIPLELGGSNASTNLWPEMGKIPNAKDAIEDALHKAVCSGHASLAEAQRDIAADWPTAGTKAVEVGSGLKSSAPVHHSTPAPTVASAPKPAPAVKPATPKTTTMSCHPLTSGGNCYEPGEFCSKAEHGESGVAGDGKSIACKQVGKSWRWEA